jgi:hypothetical protein
MKETKIALLLIVIIIGGLFTLISAEKNKYKAQCESKGGVVVNTYASHNCWKDGQYIKAE